MRAYLKTFSSPKMFHKWNSQIQMLKVLEIVVIK